MSANVTTAPGGESRIQQMLNAKDRLPEPLRRIFDALYVRGLAEEQACEALQISQEALTNGKQTLIRSLKAATA